MASTQLTVAVDNFCLKQGLMAEWGYSVHVQTPTHSLLLDTGGWLHAVLPNLRFLGIDPAAISDVCLSHGHFDHTTGLFDVRRVSPKARIWGATAMADQKWCGHDGQRSGGGGSMLAISDLHPVTQCTRITDTVTAFIVPRSERDPQFVNTSGLWQEQDGALCEDRFEDDVSLLIEGEYGFSLLLGCAHSGLPNILQYAHEALHADRFHCVIGGTHLSAASAEVLPQWMKSLQRFEVAHWRPNHCTGFRAAACLARTFDDVDWAGAGYQMAL